VAFLLRHGDLSRRSGDPAVAAAGVQVHAHAARSAEAGYEPEVSLETTIPGNAAMPELRIAGRADGILTTPDGVIVEEIKSTTAELRAIERAREPDPAAFVGAADASEGPAGDPGGRLLDWAQALCYAAMLSSARGLDAVTVRLRYVAVPSGETLHLRRSYSAGTLGSYLGELARRYAGWLARAEAWSRGREESLLDMAFPFPARRPGQAELEAAVRRAAEHGERLFVQAPTGIGKTLGVLLPALQGMGALSLRRVFYLTPRGTAAEAPLSALDLLRSRGARVRSILLCAREKSCLSPGAGCSPAFCRYARGHNDRVLAALESLLGEEAIDPRVTERFAREHRVCPHELALDASEWCDLIIGDYNYVFDPRVYLRRYQDPERSDPSAQVYLVDEAHNLLERAREM
jgi:DNA excision repair protein ERCC-2